MATYVVFYQHRTTNKVVTLVAEAASWVEASHYYPETEEWVWINTALEADMDGFNAEEEWGGFDHSLLEPGRGVCCVPDAPAYSHRTDKHDAHVWEYRLGDHDVPF
jgi:hypothetical protein